MEVVLRANLAAAGSAASIGTCTYRRAHLKANAPDRRQLVVVAGEARSANRTKWTRKDAGQSHGLVLDHVEKQQNNSAAKSLQDVDAVHELVRLVNTLGQ